MDNYIEFSNTKATISWMLFMHRGPCLIFYRDYFIQSSHSWHNYRLCSILQMRKWRLKTFSICLVSRPAVWVESRILPATLYYQWFWWGVLLTSNKTSSNCLKKKKMLGKGGSQNPRGWENRLGKQARTQGLRRPGHRNTLSKMPPSLLLLYHTF